MFAIRNQIYPKNWEDFQLKLQATYKLERRSSHLRTQVPASCWRKSLSYSKSWSYNPLEWKKLKYSKVSIKYWKSRLKAARSKDLDPRTACWREDVLLTSNPLSTQFLSSCTLQNWFQQYLANGVSSTPPGQCWGPPYCLCSDTRKSPWFYPPTLNNKYSEAPSTLTVELHLASWAENSSRSKTWNLRNKHSIIPGIWYNWEISLCTG